MNENKKTNKTRRQRGYQWEEAIVKKFNTDVDWEAMRLGGASIHLPDVFLINNNASMVLAVEAKSGTTDNLYVPADQIQRCLDWVRKFARYETQEVILAFKFSQVKRISKAKSTTRKLREYFYVWDKHRIPVEHVCTYEGELFEMVNGVRLKTKVENLEEWLA